MELNKPPESTHFYLPLLSRKNETNNQKHPYFKETQDIYEEESKNFVKRELKVEEKGPEDILSKAFNKKPSPHIVKPSVEPELQKLKHIRQTVSPQELTFKRNKRLNNPGSPLHFLDLSRECTSKIEHIKPVRNSKPWHRLTPSMKKLQESKTCQYRNLRCRGLDYLMKACKNAHSHSEVRSKLDQEQKITRKWNQTLQSTSSILKDINFCNSSVIKKLYFFNKDTDKYLLADILDIKRGSDMVVKRVKTIKKVL